MSSILDIPEVAALDARRSLIRIPPEIDVPLTRRVRQVIDTADFRRLARISQLGLVSLVYPAAHHTRFEHSLGVFRLGLLYLKRLAHDERFQAAVSPENAEIFLAAALLHDLGHWPFCHPIEDIELPGVPSHELFANSFLLEGEIGDVLRHDWNVQPREVVALLSEKPRDAASRILASMLSGPIDIDKMDYLFRDSLHAGVPYGRHFDQQRLLGSLCLNRAGDGLAITDKGRTAAELMVFARYVMFSEVYWHHGVRAATAMFQRAFYLLHGTLDLDALFRLSEHEFVAELQRVAGTGPAGDLLRGLFGPTRQLYKRLAQFGFSDGQGTLPAACPAALSLAGGLLRAFCHAGQHVPWAASWRRTRSFSTPRRSRARCRFRSRSSSPRKARGGDWPRSRRSFAPWPRSSSTITSSGSASTPIPAWSAISAACRTCRNCSTRRSSGPVANGRKGQPRLRRAPGHGGIRYYTMRQGQIGWSSA